MPVFVGFEFGKEVLVVGEFGHDGFWPDIWDCNVEFDKSGALVA
jgi:hypothetical protein